MRPLLLAILLSGCGVPALTIANHVGLGVSSAALACDWHGTRAIAEAGWGEYRDAHGDRRERYESNPMLGPEPALGTVDAYFLTMLGASVLGWYVLPKRYRLVVPLLVTAIETKAVVNNVVNRVGVCGVR